VEEVVFVRMVNKKQYAASLAVEAPATVHMESLSSGAGKAAEAKLSANIIEPDTCAKIATAMVFVSTAI
jgi:hypothetical protein